MPCLPCPSSTVSVSPAASTWEPPTWDEVVREHSARVYRLAYRLTGNQHDAEDLTQDVFIRVFRSLDGYTPGTFEGWLHRITTNLFLDRMRRARRGSVSRRSPTTPSGCPGRDPSPEAALMADLFDPDVERALASLPPDFRAAVVLVRRRAALLRRDRCHPRRQARHGSQPDLPRPRHAARRPGRPRSRAPRTTQATRPVNQPRPGGAP